MQINGKEFGMTYTVGAHCEWQDWVVAHSDMSLEHAKIESAYIMHKWWCLLNKIPEKQRVTHEELFYQPYAVHKEALSLAEAIMKGDKETTIEAKSKNPGSAEARG